MYSLFRIIKCNKITTINIMSRMTFSGQLDRYKGFHIKIDANDNTNDNTSDNTSDNTNWDQISIQQFESSLEDALKDWTSNKYRISWFRIGLNYTKFIPTLAKFGYVFHHSKTHFVVMNKWLSETEPNNIPDYAFTNIGVGGVVVDDCDRVLVVKERHFIAKKMWKFPGGYAVPNEDFGETAVREVLEETGISCQFESVIAFRHIHKFAFDCSDIYIVCHLRPKQDSNESQPKTQLNIKKCDNEITDCQWIPIEELKPHLSKFNLSVIEKFESNRKNNLKIGLEIIESIVKNINQKVYSIHT